MGVVDDCSSEDEDDTVISYILDRNPKQCSDATDAISTVAVIPSTYRKVDIPGLFEIVPADILSAVFSGWLKITDISRLDIAVCNSRSRCAYMDSLKLKGSAHYGSERPYGNGYILWLSKRSILVRHYRGHKSFLTSATVMDINDNWSICWSELTHLDLRYCAQMTSRVALRIANLSGKLVLLNLSMCRMTNSELLQVSPALWCLQSLSLMGIVGISDEAIIDVVRSCPLLQSLDLSFCRSISEFGLLQVFKTRPLLINLRLQGLESLTNNAIRHLSKQCTILQSLDLLHCKNISLVTLYVSSKLWFLHSLDLPYQQTVADSSVILDIITDNPTLFHVNILHYPNVCVDMKSLIVRFPHVNFHRTSKSSSMSLYFSIKKNL